jgi:hypothetical protein
MRPTLTCSIRPVPVVAIAARDLAHARASFDTFVDAHHAAAQDGGTPMTIVVTDFDLVRTTRVESPA